MDPRLHRHMPGYAGRHVLSRQQPRLTAAMVLYRLILDLDGSDLRTTPVTLALLVVNAAIFALPRLLPHMSPLMRSQLQPFANLLRLETTCLRPATVLQSPWLGRERLRLLWAAFAHVNELHLAYNMSALVHKGRAVERAYGSARFALLTLYLAVAAHTLYVAAAYAASRVFGAHRLLRGCVAGFSGVLFGLGVVARHIAARGTRTGPARIFGVPVPQRWAPWLEAVATSIVAPHVSLLGHLCGVAAGLLYVNGPRSLTRVGR